MARTAKANRALNANSVDAVVASPGAGKFVHCVWISAESPMLEPVGEMETAQIQDWPDPLIFYTKTGQTILAWPTSRSQTADI
jgi:hypothetical protein